MAIKENPQLQILCGSGGVGKTTLSACLALKGAQQGEKTLVVTIDPARRLAQALGLDVLSHTPQNVFSDPKSNGACFAMMLDPSPTFDRLIEKYAPNAATREKIFNNAVYKNLSSMIAGSQEYMAIEMIYDICSQNRFDRIVIDTPPLQNAADFFAAPQRIVHLLQDSMIQILLHPALKAGHTGIRFLEKAAQPLIAVFDKLVGFPFLQELSEMFTAFQELLQGFQSRSAQIQNLLQSADTQFILVTCPHVTRLSDVAGFAEQMRDLHFHFNDLIINRFFTGKIQSAASVQNDAKELAKIVSKADVKTLTTIYRNRQQQIKASQTFLKAIATDFPHLRIKTAIARATPARDLRDLMKMGWD